MSLRTIEFYTCNLCGIEKQGPQLWQHYGITDLTKRGLTRYEQRDYIHEIHICNKCFGKDSPSLIRKIVDFIKLRNSFKNGD